MEFILQLSFIHPQTGEATTESIAVLDKSDEQLEDLGLTLAESKQILGQLRQRMSLFRLTATSSSTAIVPVVV